MLKIKYVNFHLTKNIDESFKGAQGLYAEDTDTIYIDSALTDKTRYSRKTVEYHERCHRLIRRGGVKLTDLQEESLCDLWCIYRYPLKKLAGLELYLKKKIMRSKTKEGQVRKMLEICGIKPNSKILKALV